MKTLYVDVYFLINFTVDMLALYFAAIFTKTPTSLIRLLFASVVGGAYAVAATLFFEESRLLYPLSALLFISSILIASARVSLWRKIRFGIAYILFQIIIGGLVYYGYCLLDRFIGNVRIEEIGGENKNLLILSLIILLSIGVLKLAVLIFRNTKSTKSIRLCITHNGVRFYVEALVDSGNLAKDPLDATPVMLLTNKEWKRIFGCDFEIEEISSVEKLKRGFRIIPVSFGAQKKLLYGIKTDSVYAVSGKREERISVVIAIDRDEESYGGYSALIPLSALEGVNIN